MSSKKCRNPERSCRKRGANSSSSLQIRTLEEFEKWIDQELKELEAKFKHLETAGSLRKDILSTR